MMDSAEIEALSEEEAKNELRYALGVITAHDLVIERMENRIRALEAELAVARQELADADSFLVDWCNSAGWATGHGDTLVDILREMKCQQEEGLAAAKKTTAAFHRELRDLQHEVAKACQASGTMLTDLQPEAMTIVAEVCRAWPEAKKDSERLEWLEYMPETEYAFPVWDRTLKTWCLFNPDETKDVCKFKLRDAIDAARAAEDDADE